MVKVLPSEDVIKNDLPEDTGSPVNSSDVEKQEPLPKQVALDNSKDSMFKSLGWLDRFLALWIFLAMAIGIILGNFVPNTGPALQKGKFVGVSVPIGMFFLDVYLMAANAAVAVGLLVMMYPILCKVKYETLHNVLGKKDVWVQILFSVIVNWIIAPFVMVTFPCSPPYRHHTNSTSSVSLGHSYQTSPPSAKDSSSSASPAA